MRATWTRLAVGFAFTAACAVALSVSSTAQAPDPFAGTWKLDVAKSTYKPGPAPTSVTVVIEAAGKGLKVAVDGVDGEGKPIKWGYSSMRDGKPVPVTGNAMYDAAAVTQTSPNDVSIDYTKGGKPVVSAKAVVSKDGKGMTVTYSGKDISNVGVFTKQ
jgi:hypothetical protein